MDEYKVTVGKMKIETFNEIFMVDGLDCFDSTGGSVVLSSRGNLSFHRWTPDQLQCLSECALFLANRLKEQNAKG